MPIGAVISILFLKLFISIVKYTYSYIRCGLDHSTLLSLVWLFLHDEVESHRDELVSVSEIVACVFSGNGAFKDFSDDFAAVDKKALSMESGEVWAHLC